MPKTKISEFDVDPANNTDINSINIAEGCAPSGINNAIRQLMSDLKAFQTGADGDPFNGAVNGTVGATTPAAGAFTTLSATGVATVSAGTVSAPAITTSGDTNTGIYFPAADTIAFTEGGVEAARFNSNGSLAIGTTSTGATLSLNSASAVTGMRILNSNVLYADFYANSSNVVLNAVTAIPLTFGTTNTERMRIDSSGNVGIGTSSPTNFGSAFQMLAVQGSDYGVIQAISSSGSTTLEMMGASGIGYVGTRTNHPVAFRTNDTERMRIDSSGNVGIGTSSPSYKLHVVGGQTRLDVSSAGTSLVCLGTGSNFQVDHSTSGYATLINSANSGAAMIFKGSSESMRIDSSGNLLVGTTSGAARLFVQSDASLVDPVTVSNTNTTANSQYAIVFVRNGVVRGSIQTTNTATSYITSSDYRLKDNIAPMTGALATVQALKPVTYTWKDAGLQGQGFIAHELQEVVPDCVTGEKDAVDAEGKPVYQGIDVSFLVATLTAAIQEMKAIIDAQAERITALENK